MIFEPDGWKEEAGERKKERKREEEGQLIKASSFNNANVITCTGPHTCLAPNRINNGVVERKSAVEPEKPKKEHGDNAQIHQINRTLTQNKKGNWR